MKLLFYGHLLISGGVFACDLQPCARSLTDLEQELCIEGHHEVSPITQLDAMAELQRDAPRGHTYWATGLTDFHWPGDALVIVYCNAGS